MTKLESNKFKEINREPKPRMHADTEVTSRVKMKMNQFLGEWEKMLTVMEKQ
jgi:hypothetical protein